MPMKHCTFRSLGDLLVAKLFLPETLPVTPLPCIIVAHGAIDRKENFFELAHYFVSRGFAALVLDMHGHGESEGPRYHVRMDQWVSDLKAALDFVASQNALDAERTGIFGFSSGGTAALELAVKDQRAKALVTLDATVRTVVNPFEAAGFRFFSALGRLKRKWLGRDLHLPLYRIAIQTKVTCDPDVHDAFVQDDYLKAGYSRYPLPGALESLVINTLARVPEVRCPVCVIHGEEDQIDSPESARLLYDQLTCSKALHIIPGNGHVGHMDFGKQKVMTLAADWFVQHL